MQRDDREPRTTDVLSTSTFRHQPQVCHGARDVYSHVVSHRKWKFQAIRARKEATGNLQDGGVIGHPRHPGQLQEQTPHGEQFAEAHASLRALGGLLEGLRGIRREKEVQRGQQRQQPGEQQTRDRPHVSPRTVARATHYAQIGENIQRMDDPYVAPRHHVEFIGRAYARGT